MLNYYFVLDLRLKDGDDDASGRVEVFMQGQWGTICDDNFDDTEATIICKKLG